MRQCLDSTWLFNDIFPDVHGRKIKYYRPKRDDDKLIWLSSFNDLNHYYKLTDWSLESWPYKPASFWSVLQVFFFQGQFPLHNSGLFIQWATGKFIYFNFHFIDCTQWNLIDEGHLNCRGFIIFKLNSQPFLYLFLDDRKDVFWYSFTFHVWRLLRCQDPMTTRGCLILRSYSGRCLPNRCLPRIV